MLSGFVDMINLVNHNGGVGILKTQWLLILALLFALITAIFAVINVNSVEVNFLFATTNIPLILVIVGSTLLGGIIVGIFGIVRQYQLQKKIRLLENESKAHLNELSTQTHTGRDNKKEEALDTPPISIQE
jgi:putative membrane protein